MSSEMSGETLYRHGILTQTTGHLDCRWEDQIFDWRWRAFFQMFIKWY